MLKPRTCCLNTRRNDSLRLPAASAEAMQELGARLSAALGAGDAVLLRGPLGCGKTTLARGLLRRLTGDPGLTVPSPSYTLVQTYETPLGLAHHVDLYRIESASECAELGLDEMAGRDLMVVEWPERLPESPPTACIDLSFHILPDGTREVTATAGDSARRQRLDSALTDWP